MRVRRLLFAAAMVVTLVLMWPVLASVYSEAGRTLTLSPSWSVAIVGAVAAQMVANWELQRIILRTPKWLDVAAPQLVGNAASHLLPAGNAIGAGLHVQMLTAAGFPATTAVSSLGAVTVIGAITGLVLLPLIVLAASAAGSSIDPGLVRGMWVGAVALLVILATVVVLFSRDRPWQWIAAGIARVRRRFGRESDPSQVAGRLLDERDHIRVALQDRIVWVLLVDFVRASGDYLALYFALRATGAHVNPAAVLAAFIVSNIAGMVPLTPGGLGFVEASLAGVLVIAGAGETHANLTVATYRLAATWLPCLAGAIAFLWFRHRHRGKPIGELFPVEPQPPLVTAPHPGSA
jgi:uncharacterized protein (TIRG00374 family)